MEETFAQAKSLEVGNRIWQRRYLARLAQSRPETNFVGFEEYCQRIHRTLRKLSRIDNDNVRVLGMDVRPAFEYLFTPETIQYIHCLYPPPWPKKSDAKHRLFTTAFLRMANNRLADKGTLKIVTDHYPYILWIQEQVPETGFD